ncbi:helix-turn-helix transcriptional regulator [uncultured Selenomonas sp.]|uniref:helix-turn-helix domain-containing protein n=1 Tax=uncultured Selenomonas sp. TaxID=159275 RepID=UPI00343B2C02
MYRNNVKTSIADNLKRQLIQTGYTNKELAEKSGLSRATIQKAVAGKSMPPATVKKIADALDVNPLDLAAL